MADACRDGRFERFWRAQASSAYRGKDRFHEGPRGAGVDVVRPKKTSAETFETAMFIVTLRTRLEALRTTCARRARQPGTERAPAAAPASQPPPAPPRSLSAELKPTLGPITDASSGAKGDRVLRGDGWGRGGRGRQGGAEQRAAGGGGSQCHQVGEAAPRNRAVKRWVGVKTPDRAADGVGDTDETATRQATASPPRAEQPPEGAGWPPCTPGDEGGRREASAPPDGGAGGHADHLPVHTGFLQPRMRKVSGL